MFFAPDLCEEEHFVISFVILHDYSEKLAAKLGEHHTPLP